MCQYSYEDGYSNDWQLVHLGARAVGGAGVVFTEATAVEARGRISPGDLGIWKDGHVEALGRVARFIRGQGAVAGIQLAHAGWKASTAVPWEGRAAVAKEQGGWEPVGVGGTAFTEGYPVPRELATEEIAAVVDAFRDAAQRALGAGFQVIELHAAHGYLMHSFLSPVSNKRLDRYGGSFANRTRLVQEVVTAVREVWPEALPLWVRFSCSDWVEGGWDVEQSVELARAVKRLGVDCIDCSSGGIAAKAKIPTGPGYQVPFAEKIRKEAEIATAAVGMITSPEQANEIVGMARADFALLARESLRDAEFGHRAATALGEKVKPPVQYERAF